MAEQYIQPRIYKYNTYNQEHTHTRLILSLKNYKLITNILLVYIVITIYNSHKASLLKYLNPFDQ